MKKQFISSVLILLTLSVCIISCGSGNSEKGGESDSLSAPQREQVSTEERNDSAIILGGLSFGDDTLSNKDRNIKSVLSLIISQENCAASTTDSCASAQYGTPTNCTDTGVYCGNSDCTKKIICCHRISEEIFDTLTENKTKGHAIFNQNKVHNIVIGANCKTQYIRFSSYNTTYYMNRVNNINPTGDDWISYYSVALMQGLVDKGINSVVLYRGLIIKTPGVTYRIVPFQVNFTNGKVEFYDVSDSQP